MKDLLLKQHPSFKICLACRKRKTAVTGKRILTCKMRKIQWPEGVSMDEVMDRLAKEAIEVEHERATARKRRDLIEEAHSQRGASV